jgi:adenosine kinase
MSGDELADGLVGANILICNDYEYELLKQKTGLDEAAVLKATETLIVTKGEHGSSIMTREGAHHVSAVAPRRIVDPTGVGDAYRGGLIKGLALGLPAHTAAQLGSVAAAYALEHLGGTSHAYTFDEFTARYEEHFPPLNANSSVR